MNWYQNLPPFVQAVIERMVRGGIAGVVAGYVAGTLVFDTLNVHTFGQVASLFIGGAVSALLISLGVQVGTKGKGPALTGVENLAPATSSAKHKPVQGGWGDAGLILLVYIAIAVTLLLFRVRFGG